MGLREQKKANTRKAISDMATRLFFERGYHAVTTAEIAKLAEVSVPTLFNYFPTKESLVFDEDSEQERGLIDTVANRRAGQSILDGLLEAGLGHIDAMNDSEKKGVSKFMELIDRTPELSLYAKQMWMRHEKALAGAIRKEKNNKIPMIEAEAIARFVLDAYYRAIGAPHPKPTLRALFKVLREGWAG